MNKYIDKTHSCNLFRPAFRRTGVCAISRHAAATPAVRRGTTDGNAVNPTMMTAPLASEMPTIPMVQQAPGAPAIQQVPVIPVTQQFQTIPGPSTMTTDNILFTPGYMRTQIGRRVKVEFLLGTNMLVDREGTLEAVGANYIIIQEAETDDLLLCDLFSIKFVKFFY